MVTIKDIAKRAGVSHGTVSNVINKRGNVSLDKIRLVEKAAAELGYSVNAQAKLLRKDVVRHVAIILPYIESEPYHTFYITLSTHLKELGNECSLHLSENLLDNEKKCIKAALSFRPLCIVAMSCASNPIPLYNVGVQVCLINQKIESTPPMIRCITFDFVTIARDIGRYIREAKFTRAACFLDGRTIPADQSLLAQLQPLLFRYDITCDVFSCDHKLLANTAFELILHEPAFDVVVAGDMERANKLRAAAMLCGKPTPKIIALSAVETFPTFDTIRYELDYALLARDIAVTACSPDIRETACLNVVPYAKGFRFLTQPAHSATKAPEEIMLITLASPTTNALKILSNHFFQQTNIRLNIIALPHEEMNSALNENTLGHFDLIRMDLVWLARFEQNLCMPLNREDPAVASMLASFLPSIRDAYCAIDRPLHTLPFDPSTQMLYYRKDLFEDATLKRLYFETNHKYLEVPGDFITYNEVAAFFTKAYNPFSPVLYGSTLTFGSAAVAACDFLPRLKSMGGSIFNENGELEINSKLSCAALENYLATRCYASNAINYWWAYSMEAFASGETAMTMVFINHASSIINSRNSTVIGKVGAAALPGNAPLLGGGCIGISKYSEKTDACMAFLRWVYSEEISSLLTLLGGLTPCKSAYENEEVLRLYPWLRSYEPCFRTASRQNVSPLYPHFNDYRFEQLLGMAVRNAAMGVSSVEEALGRAQNAYAAELASTAPNR